MTGAPLVLLEVALRLREKGHQVSFLLYRSGPLEQELRWHGFPFFFVADVFGMQQSSGDTYPLDSGSYNVVLANTITMHPWLRDQAEAWGLPFLRRVVWFVHELPSGVLGPLWTGGGMPERHLLARAGAVLVPSAVARDKWERWVLSEAHTLGLDFSPLIGRQESFEPDPPLPPALPTFHTLLRARINASDTDYVLLFSGTHDVNKGSTQIVEAFAHAWERAAVLPGAARKAGASRAPGSRLLLLMVGGGMQGLVPTVHQEWQQLRQRRLRAAEEVEAFLGAVHLYTDTADSLERLGWLAAADALVVNSEVESFGRVTLEAMAASLPVISSRNGGSQELVVDGITGLIHPPPSASTASTAALTAHMLRLDRRTAAGRQLAAAMGTAACRRAHSVFAPQDFHAAVDAAVRRVAEAAALADAQSAASAGAGMVRPASSVAGPDSSAGGAASDGPQLAVGGSRALAEGLTPEAAAILPGGWAAGFGSDPRNQALVKGERIVWEWWELPAAPFYSYDAVSWWLRGSLYRRGAGALAVSALKTVASPGGFWWPALQVSVPAELAETHVAFEQLGDRHVYLASGQKGLACSPATGAAFRLDLGTLQFHPLPPVPQPRYAAVMAHLGGRLHFFGGLLPDRTTPSRDHWSLSLAGDGSADGDWRAEPPLPAHLGGSHATRVLLRPRIPAGEAGEALYVWGWTAQESTPRNAGAGDHNCSAGREWGDASLWSFSSGRHLPWRRHRDLPLPLLHASQCTIKIGQDAALVAGGQHYTDWLSRTIWLYNATEDSWTQVGHTPVYLRGHTCTLHRGHMLMTMGQTGQNSGCSPTAGAIEARQFVARLPPQLQALVDEQEGQAHAA
ncbi:hypothetical protein ABPG75_001900 [Micractinium tetrahymenae]